MLFVTCGVVLIIAFISVAAAAMKDIRLAKSFGNGRSR
jgi:hypothetical protein